MSRPMAIATAERNKLHVNVGTIGHIDHGKTTLSAALAARSDFLFPGEVRVKGYDQISAGGHRRDATKTITVITGHAEYVSAVRRLRPRGLSGPRRLREKHDHRRGPDGCGDCRGLRHRWPDAADAEHILLARQVGVPKVIVFLNKVDLVEDPELVDLVELEMRELLTKFGFPGDEVPLIRGSGSLRLRDRFGRCRKRVDRRADRGVGHLCSRPARAMDRPFLMPVENVYAIRGRGTVVTGRIERAACARATRWKSSA